MAPAAGFVTLMKTKGAFIDRVRVHMLARTCLIREGRAIESQRMDGRLPGVTVAKEWGGMSLMKERWNLNGRKDELHIKAKHRLRE